MNIKSSFEPVTRRTFLKRSAIAVGAYSALASGVALADPENNSSNSSGIPWEYALKCEADPLDGGAEPGIGGGGSWYAKSAPPDYFDPGGWGDEASYNFTLVGLGPKKGDISLSFEVHTFAAATVSNPGGGPEGFNWNKFDLAAEASDTGKMTINATTGHITYLPDPPVQKTGTGGQPNLHIWAQVSPHFQAAGYTQYQNEGNPLQLTTITVGIAEFQIPGPSSGTITRPPLTLDWTITVVRRLNGGPWQDAPTENQPEYP